MHIAAQSHSLFQWPPAEGGSTSLLFDSYTSILPRRSCHHCNHGVNGTATELRRRARYDFLPTPAELYPQGPIHDLVGDSQSVFFLDGE